MGTDGQRSGQQVKAMLFCQGGRIIQPHFKAFGAAGTAFRLLFQPADQLKIAFRVIVTGDRWNTEAVTQPQLFGQPVVIFLRRVGL